MNIHGFHLLEDPAGGWGSTGRQYCFVCDCGKLGEYVSSQREAGARYRSHLLPDPDEEEE